MSNDEKKTVSIDMRGFDLPDKRLSKTESMMNLRHKIVEEYKKDLERMTTEAAEATANMTGEDFKPDPFMIKSMSLMLVSSFIKGFDSGVDAVQLMQHNVEKIKDQVEEQHPDLDS